MPGEPKRGSRRGTSISPGETSEYELRVRDPRRGPHRTATFRGRAGLALSLGRVWCFSTGFCKESCSTQSGCSRSSFAYFRPSGPALDPAFAVLLPAVGQVVAAPVQDLADLIKALPTIVGLAVDRAYCTYCARGLNKRQGGHFR